MNNVIIVGAGPAGLLAAIALGKQNKRVLILEKNNVAGKKLLLSGAGQCNVTHGGSMTSYSRHYGDRYKYIKRALSFFTNEDTVNFFEKQGLDMEQLENGKIFPKTRLANDVLGVLLKESAKNGVVIHYNTPVSEVGLQDDTYLITTPKGTYKASHLIIATGGMSYPKTGSNGDGYLFAKALGHKVIQPRPALTPVEIKDFPFSDLAGMSFENISLSIWKNGKKEQHCAGDMLFTHKGLSGPVILNNSRWIEEEDVLYVNFIKAHNMTSFNELLLNQIDQSGKSMIKTVLRQYDLPKRLLDAVLAHISIDEDTQCAQINKEARKLLVGSLVAFPFSVSKLGGFHIAMVTAGGVCMKQINPTTMASRLHQNLYFIGEVLDIDGDTGGYNIQAALSSAVLCANEIQRKEKR